MIIQLEMADKDINTSHSLVVVAIVFFTFAVVLSSDYETNYRDICPSNANCSCINFNSTKNATLLVLCEGVIYLEYWQFRPTHPAALEIRCISNDFTDYYEYTSLLYHNYIWRNGNDIPKFTLMFNNCSLPTRGFASMFSPDLGNSSLSSINNEIRMETLAIHCRNIQNLQLMRNHLRGLVLLKYIEIECPSLTNLQEDTFRDVAGTLTDVEIRFTAISEIPRTLFHNVTKLQHLFLNDNKIKFIHEDAFVGLKIEYLFLENNQIQVLDGLFSHSHNLEFIEIQSNNIIHLPIDMGGCNEVRIFNAIDNRIKCISEKHFEGMASLTHLYLSLNNISYIHPKAFYNNSDLRKLHLNGNSLGRYTSRYSECFNSSSISVGLESDEGKQSLMPLDERIFSNNERLEVIDLSENFIDSLPENIFSNNKELKNLKLHSNNISNLSEKLLQNNFLLEELNLANNNIVEIPIGFLKKQSHIEYLYLNENELTSLDKDFLSNSSRLEVFDVHSNRIKSLPIELFDRCNGSLRILDLSCNQLTSFPNFYIPLLTSLNLANNNLTKIEDETFHEMSKLQSLNLSCNFIHTIDSHPIYLVSQLLSTLDISNNNLSGINREWFPSEFTNITIKLFNYSGNIKLSILPKFLFDVEELDISRMSEETKWSDISQYDPHELQPSEIAKTKILNLSHNNLRSYKNTYWWDQRRRIVGIQFVFHRMTKLEVLNLSHNMIDVIPLELRTQLPNLRVLDLSHNWIKYLHRDDFLVFKGLTYHFNLPFDDEYDFAYSIPYVPYDEEWYLREFFMYPYLKEFRQKWANAEGEISHSLVVDLRHNIIQGVDLNRENMELVPRVCWKDDLFSHATYLLGHNPIGCGCDVLQLISYSLEEMRPVGEHERTTRKRKFLPAKVNIDDLSCHMPESVRGKKVSEPESWMYHLLPLYGMCKLMSVEIVE